MLVLKAAHHPAFAALEPVLPSGVPLRKWGFKRKLNFPGTSLYLSTTCNNRETKAMRLLLSNLCCFPEHGRGRRLLCEGSSRDVF